MAISPQTGRRFAAAAEWGSHATAADCWPVTELKLRWRRRSSAGAGAGYKPPIRAGDLLQRQSGVHMLLRRTAGP